MGKPGRARSVRPPWFSHGDPCSSVRGRRAPANGPTVVIFDAAEALIHPTQFHRPEVYVPEPVVDFLQPDKFARQRVCDAHPGALPADAAVFTDATHFKMRRVLDRW